MKTAMKYHCVSIRIAKIRKVNNTKCWEDVEQLEHSYFVRVRNEMVQPLGRLALSYEVRHTLVI